MNSTDISVSGDQVFITVAGVGPQGAAGGESGTIVTSGSSYTVSAVQPGSPFNVIVRKGTGSATLINLPAPNPLAPWGRVNVFDGKGDAATNNITVADPNGTIYVFSIGFESLSFLDDGTTWNIQ